LKKDINQEEIEVLKSNMFSNDWELVCDSANKLGKFGGREITDFLISLLENENSGIRDRASLALEEIGDNKALKPLLRAIFNKQNKIHSGTMVFALESLDCSKHLKDIYKILFYFAYECKMGAMSILETQIFDFTKQDLIEIKEMWENCLLNPETCPEIENEKVKIEMQESVDAFISYLKD
jgi:hypothetical protein